MKRGIRYLRKTKAIYTRGRGRKKDQQGLSADMSAQTTKICVILKCNGLNSEFNVFMLFNYIE